MLCRNGGGWETADMVRRYARLTADHLAPYAKRLCALRVVACEADDTNRAHVQENSAR